LIPAVELDLIIHRIPTTSDKLLGARLSLERLSHI
jgi:hypothetical protein